MKTCVKSLLLSASLILVGLMPLPGRAQDFALGGFDPVVLFSEDRAVAGKADLVTMWHGQLWHFVSETNRAAFEANPRAFAPGLGGMCPVALAEGRSEPGRPDQFVVIGSRLYLLRSDDAREKILADPRGVLMQAKQFWARLNP